MDSPIRCVWWVLLLLHFAARAADNVRCACGVAGGMCTRRGIRDWWTWTGRGLVKMSARLSAPLRHVTMNCFCAMRSRIQWKRMSMLLVFLGLMVSSAIPTAHLLSHRMMVGSWGYPRECRICRSQTPSWPARNSAAYSASATDETTDWIMVLKEWTEPLMWVGWLALPR